MTLSKAIYDVCSTCTTLTALVGDRIYFGHHQPTGEPQVTIRAPVTDDNSVYRTHDGAPGRRVVIAQFDCYGATANEAEKVGDAVVACWDGYQSATLDIGYAFKDNRFDDGYQASMELFRQIVDIRIETGV